jgi:hypothetical protein
MQPTGDVTFDTAAGRMVSVKYQFARELRGHNGEGSKYNFASSYSEELMKEKN